jgi:hypothetical protein
VVDPNTAVIFERVSEGIPKREFASFAWMQRLECVNIAKPKNHSVATVDLCLGADRSWMRRAVSFTKNFFAHDPKAG